MKTDPQAPLLDVQHLRVSFVLRRGVLHAVDDVSFSLQEKESLGIVGETGCGKSITGLSIMAWCRVLQAGSPAGFFWRAGI